MEFKFRAVDHNRRPLNYLSPRLTSAAQPDGFLSNSDRWQMRKEMIEIEKQRIREEIMLRRRVLEAEVLREVMMMEREISMRDQPRVPFPFTHHFNYYSCLRDYPLNLPLNLPSPLPFDAPPPPAASSSSSSLGTNKDTKVILLAKPEPSLCGAKRKVATTSAGGVGELTSDGLKKKTKEEWSCALCQVSATSERGLNEHIWGRKHKAKEAALKAQNVAKNSSIAPLVKKIAEPAKYSASSAWSEMETEMDRASLQVNQNKNYSDKLMQNKEDIDDKDNELSVQKATQRGSSKKNAAARGLNSKTTQKLGKQKFKFWCEMCQVGVYAQVVMESHVRGKKHLAQLKERSQNGKTIPCISAASTEASETLKDVEILAKEATDSTKNVGDDGKTSEGAVDNEKTAEDVANDEKRTDDVANDDNTTEDAVVDENLAEDVANDDKTAKDAVNNW